MRFRHNAPLRACIAFVLPARSVAEVPAVRNERGGPESKRGNERHRDSPLFLSAGSRAGAGRGNDRTTAGAPGRPALRASGLRR